ncbi:hypothetical protein [Streptomyces poriticola]|uniref:hypothetical protein n=1 Tax=Streptomyces poriticola TaxID=3120506 RepID=UPI002FCE1151
MTTPTGGPVPVRDAVPVASAPAQDDPVDDGTATADLVLPLVAVGAAAVLAGYGYLRRTRRARTRTTPGGAEAGSAGPPYDGLDALDRQAGAALTEADDCVRASREELGFAGALHGTGAVEPFARALREAESELAAAFRMRQRYDDGVPEEPAARRHALAGIVGRCQEAGRRLDAEAAGSDRLRGLEAGVGPALALAEARFRELTARTGTAQGALADLGTRYPPSATAPVAGAVEQAKDRLVFATSRLNLAHQAADAGDLPRAAAQLRAAEGAIAQADVLLTGVERRATALRAAARLVPAALTGAEAALARARHRVDVPAAGADLDMPVGEARVRLRYADDVLAAVREELTGGPYDPLAALRRIVRALAPTPAPETGVLSAAALFVARDSTAAAADTVTTHRAAVGAAARTRLAEAQRLLGAGPPDAPDPVAADELAGRARELAEQDVRLYGHPAAGAAGEESGAAGALLGGVLLGNGPDGGPPPSFGGPDTRARRSD